MVVYCIFIVYMIIAFGTLTLTFHQQFLNGDPVAMGLALFIGTFWTMRLIVDFTYYSHDDWPKGIYFQVGHILLNVLFFFLVAVYMGLFILHKLQKI